MESDEALSEALLSRKPIRRVALACIACRLRKVKCDSTQPSCIRCRVDGKQCEYQKSRRGGRPRRPAAAPVQAASWPDPAQAPTINGPVVHAPPSLSVAGSTSARSGSSGSSRSPFRTSPPSSTGNSDALLDLGSLFGFGSVAWLREATSGITGIQADRLLTQYYVYFHASHPCVLPKVALHARLVNEPGFACTLLPVLLYIGSIFTDSAPSDLLSEIALKAVNEVRSQGSHFTPVFVQTLTLYSIAVYWCNEPQRGRNILDEAIQVAVDIGMHRAQFAKQHGCDDPVLEESWRRTWWQLYITDAHIAGSTHTFPTKTGALHITTELPCEEELYDCGVRSLIAS
ncbi:hypothetical protein BU24DRAFT_428857 [Aaosphaeria arxii CBS 175.79]|uniref:Zn(2)-C6 fungal-type domain-containing protein n=1 Tax=Aaosphaeria arxii CBS 175.79 TaxID=1450172 RepID=A0A6A5X8T6_9PLEO|nr:uncharacterized protein BU24DRAFT_428857 [Aaosphaeria arxii CBS 175.79]KAF2009320.1 hypothetical protein BU24DRAFT_428857 [Aaosphaeria arxii CBS 175.79]